MKIGENAKKNIRTVAVFAVFVLSVLTASLLPCLLDNAEKSRVESSLIEYTDHSAVEPKTAEVCGTELVNLEGECHSVLYVNHTPDEFVNPFPYRLSGKVERVDALTPATSGTLQFVFFNIDPMAEDFKSQAASLSRFSLGNDKLINVSFYLPACFDAATVYAYNTYLSTSGDMGEYSPTDYYDPYLSNSFQMNQIGSVPQYADMAFPLERTTIYPDRFEAARIVTVHYRAAHGVDFSGNLPLVGSKAAIKSALTSRTNFHISLIAVAGAIAVAFGFLLFLKRRIAYAGQLGILIAAALLLAAGLLPAVGSASAGAALGRAASALMLFFAVLSSLRRSNASRLEYVLLGIAFANVLAGIVLPLTLSPHALSLYAKLAACILGGAAVALGARKWLTGGNQIEFLGVLTACIASLFSAFSPFPPLSGMHPAAAVSSISVLCVLALIFIDIFKTERRNAALTHNLEAEVAAQTAALGRALSDRERILSFLSHDMKKSALGIDALVGELKRTAPDDAVKSAARKIETKNTLLLQSFSEILRFTKQSFTDESFSSFPLETLLDELDSRVRQDCEANGIRLTIRAKKLTVRAKRTALFSVLFNLIFNAIEHAECTEISVTAKKSKGQILLQVADNGKGISDPSGIFNPYISEEENTSNAGLGLFIVKSETESMGGTLTCDVGKGTVFTLTLLCE